MKLFYTIIGFIMAIDVTVFFGGMFFEENMSCRFFNIFCKTCILLLVVGLAVMLIGTVMFSIMEV